MGYEDRNVSPDERARDLLAQMTLEEKMGQICAYFPRNWSKEDLKEQNPYGAGEISCFGMREIENAEELERYQRELQDAVMELSEHRIPALFHIEGLCGILVKGAQAFPSGIGRGATWNPRLEERVGEIVGKQSLAVGAHQVLAPVLDISRDARLGRQGEAYGEDPVLAGEMGSAYVRGIHKGGRGHVMATAKHFIGYHAGMGGIHAANSLVTDRELEEIYAKPFQTAISEEHLEGVMPCYSAVNGEPISGSEKYLRKLLREKMGFEGIIVADYCSVSEMHERQKLYETLEEAGKQALKAGVDSELPSVKSYNANLLEEIRQGAFPEEFLNQAVLRMLTMKFKLGLFENPYAFSGRQIEDIFLQKEAEDTGKEAAAESVVLLKNNGILPLKDKKMKIAVIGHHGASVRTMYGGYSYISMTERWLGSANTMAGVDEKTEDLQRQSDFFPGSRVQREHPLAEQLARRLEPKAQNLYEAIQAEFQMAEVSYAYGYPYIGDDESSYGEALQIAGEADVVIVTLGGKYGTGSMSSTGEGIDSVSIQLPQCQERFLEKLSNLNKPCIGIHFDGRPVSSDRADALDALIEAWSPAGTGGEVLAEILSGKRNPSGRLPVSVAYCAGQEPVFYNHLNGSGCHQGSIGAFDSYVDCDREPRYAFGYGMSYTTFVYRNLKLDKREILPNEEIRISIEVENTGAREGMEVVQLYLRDTYATIVRPVQELAGFYKVVLKPGERKVICFRVLPGLLAYLDHNMEWKIEKGEVEVLVGASSEEIHAKDSFHVTETIMIEGRTRPFYAEAEEKKIL